jgi:hypothetical protein
VADVARAEPETARLTQAALVRSGLRAIRMKGMEVFSTSFVRAQGFGDGPYDTTDPFSPGGRPTLQGNGMMLRVNGLDSQSCIECHCVVSARTVPPTFGVGGAGGMVTNAIIRPTTIDPADVGNADGKADFDGRFANPPFVFGAGGVELLGIEMTEDLQRLADAARANPDGRVDLVTKGVSFGSLVARPDGTLDTSAVEGVDPDLVVRPFGRKGEFATTREFDVGAMGFHFGMQPVEVVGEDVDADGDGVANEVLVGELSALSVFATTLERPVVQAGGRGARRGAALFETLGCADCHVPSLETRSRRLPLRFPEVPTQPRENVFYEVNLSHRAPGFERTPRGGVDVPLFADLKRHDMGPHLAESFTFADDRRNREFTTARLWGVADTAPYLHDGRATTILEAILLHGGESLASRDAFAALGAAEQQAVLAFLGTLRTPRRPRARAARRGLCDSRRAPALVSRGAGRDAPRRAAPRVERARDR